MAFFAVHFIYRYGAVNLDFKKKFVSGFNQIFLFIVPAACGILWGFTVKTFMSPSKMKSDFIREDLMQNFNVSIDEVVYVGLYFWPKDSNGYYYPDLMSFIGNACMWIILGSSLSSVIYFGTNCYRYISKQLGGLATQSQASKSLQSQLFYALIVQAVIPCFLMYLPASSIFTCPMLNYDPEFKYPFVAITIAIYPAIDPLPTIIIIKSYRKGFFELFKCRKKNQISVEYSNTAAVPSAIPSAVPPASPSAPSNRREPNARLTFNLAAI
uniref:Seven TM Receptor n=1 Tax=Caenorhabditis tropicalis TaxID=1561998 RepID=A0A1I7U9F4_9PELO